MPAGFFGGGGGGGFLAILALISGLAPTPTPPAATGCWRVAGWACSAVGEAVGEVCFSRKLFRRPVTLYFLFRSLARREAVLIFSWCCARKSFMFLPAAMASAAVTLEGSWCRFERVWTDWVGVCVCVCGWAGWG